MTVSTRKVSIQNIDIKGLARKSESPLGNHLLSLMQPEITRQRPFKIADIEYDLIKYGIVSMERVDYNNSIGINFIDVDDIEDLENLLWT